MIDPSWLADTLAAIVLATAAYCAGRIGVALLRRHTRRIELDADLTHVLMGIAMAGMFVTRLAIRATAAWSVVFGLTAAWYLARIALAAGHRRDRWGALSHHAGHVISALAMLYMVLAMPSSVASAPMSAGSMGAGMGGDPGTGAHVPTLALLFAVLVFGYAVLVADRIPLTAAPTTDSIDSRTSDSGGATVLGIGRGTLLAPRAIATCEIVMNVAMGAMLVAML